MHDLVFARLGDARRQPHSEPPGWPRTQLRHCLNRQACSVTLPPATALQCRRALLHVLLHAAQAPVITMGTGQHVLTAEGAGVQQRSCKLTRQQGASVLSCACAEQQGYALTTQLPPVSLRGATLSTPEHSRAVVFAHVRPHQRSHICAASCIEAGYY